MTLQDIFDDINSNYNTVKSLSNQIYTPLRSDIDQNWTWAKIYSDDARYWIYTDWQYFNSNIWLSTREIIWLLEEFIDQMFMTAHSTESKLQDIFNYYLAYVVTDVQRAVEFVELEMWDAVEQTRIDVWDEINDLESYIHDEVTRMYNEMDRLSQDVIGWIDAAVADAVEEMYIAIEEVNETLTTRIANLEELVAVYNQQVYDYIDIQIADLTTYIDQANATLYVYINNRVLELETLIAAVEANLHDRITIEINGVTAVIGEVEASLTIQIEDLADTTGWNFTFFDLFTFTPELSLLRTLLRSDEDFNYYKPYWQALFARVFKEDE